MAASLSSSVRDAEQKITYSNPTAPRIEIKAPEGRPQESWKDVMHIGADVMKNRDAYYVDYDVKIVDARTHLPGGKEAWKFEEHGFCFLDAVEPVADFTDKKLVERDHQPRVLDSVKEATGASRVFWMSHMPRSEKKQGLGSGTQGYASVVAHSDYGPAFEKQFRLLLEKRYKVPQEEAQSCGVCLANLWRPIERPAYKDPLALLDASTIQMQTETMPWSLQGMDVGFQNLGGRPVAERIPAAASDAPAIAPCYAPQHRWVFLPDMQVEEAVLFKQYDFRPNATAKATFHCSFPDRFHNAWKDCPGRRSVECRLILTFDNPASKL